MYLEVGKSLNPHHFFSVSCEDLSWIFFHVHFNGTIFSIQKVVQACTYFSLISFPPIQLHFQIRAAKINGNCNVMFQQGKNDTAPFTLFVLRELIDISVS